MKKIRILCLVLALTLMLTACAKKKDTKKDKNKDTDTKTEEVQDLPETPTGFINPLTGERSLETEAQTQLRPIAVAINNISGAQKVQTGLNSADIVYETYVEGGITRLLAVYKDISKAGELGTVRSARYDFVDIACADDSLYVHAGIDPTYCAPYIRKLGLDSKNMLENSYYGYAYRLSNGLALEHTLYTTGPKLAAMVADKGIRSTVNSTHAAPWQNFNETAAPLPGGSATTISAKFSGSYKSTFVYDAATDSYNKQNHNDWRSGAAVNVKNVVVLFTDLSYRDSSGYRVKVGLSGGSGYYFSNGTFQQINWTKGGTYDRFKFTDINGQPLAYNPGNTWVCIVSKNVANNITIE